MTYFLLGVRMAFTGGRDSWTRLVLISLGVGMGVALMLLGAAAPTALEKRQDRGDARAYPDNPPALDAGADTLLIGKVDTQFRARPVRGRLVRPEGPQAPVPPGLDRVPGPGQVYVSPALAALLRSPEAALIAPRLGGATTVGTIDDIGLAGPNELAFYLGSGSLSPERALRISEFGIQGGRVETSPLLLLLIVVATTVLILPILTFLGVAVRFGGERRDQRLAALRLIGSDAGMIRRITVGETLAGAGIGLAVGLLLFQMGRLLAPRFTIWNISVFSGDLRPVTALAAIVLIGVPVPAVAVALASLRTVVIEPMGVVRRAGGVRRKLLWRVAVVAAGVACIVPDLNAIRGAEPGAAFYRVAVGVALLLAGVVVLLPYVIDLVVRRLPGNAVSWQLAVRRLQADGNASVRLVSGAAVATAGAIGLQMLISGVQGDFTSATGKDLGRAEAVAQIYSPADAVGALAALQHAKGVERPYGTIEVGARLPGADSASQFLPVRVGDCSALSQFGAIEACSDGDVFLANGPGRPPAVKRGSQVELLGGDGPWRVPASLRTISAREDPGGLRRTQLLVTPSALDPSAFDGITVSVFVSFSRAVPDAVEYFRNAVGEIDPQGSVSVFTRTDEARNFVNVKRAIYIGVLLTLILVVMSMLAAVVDQMRERARLLAILSALGVERSTISRSILWLAVIPLAIGMLVAVTAGITFGLLMLGLLGEPLAMDWPAVGLTTFIASASVMIVTLVGLPALRPLMRADAIRSE